jgi:hypothetical protein
MIASATYALQSHGQSQVENKTPLAFEVATVKPSPAGARGGGIRPLPGGQDLYSEQRSSESDDYADVPRHG